MSNFIGANTFKRFFDEPQHYPGHGYVFAAKDQVMLFNRDEAIEYFVDWLMAEWLWIPRDNRKYVFCEVREHITDGFVKWHGGINDDGEMGNAWWPYSEWKANQKGFKHVWVADFQKHYIVHGHHFEPIISSWGMPSSHNDSDCVMCRRLKLAKLEGALEERTTVPIADIPKGGKIIATNDQRIEQLQKEIGYYDSCK